MRQIRLSGPEGVRWVPTEQTGDGVLVVAGSSGRVDAERARVFAGLGAVAESIRWFGGPEQQSGPWEIPLETFLQRLDDLRRECDRVWMVGTSFGSEAALLCGALHGGSAGVVAFAPSSVVWAGYDDEGRQTSHWTLNDQPLPYVPFDWTGYVEETPARFRPLYERSMQAYPDRAAAASIPVERIPRLVVVAGGDDQVWPSTGHAEQISSRRAGFGLSTTAVTSPEAGHRTILPGEHLIAGGAAMLRGGSEREDRRLGQQAWEAIGRLLDEASADTAVLPSP